MTAGGLDLCAVLPMDLAARVVSVASPRARRVSLRVDPAGARIVLVHPARANPRAVLAFVASRADWIRTHLDALPARIPFTDGACIPIAGADHRLRFAPEARGGVWREGDTILIAGRPEFAARRMKDWLKAEAKRALAPMAHAMAALIGRRVARITVRDTTSRWGSCSADGGLSFSWRLILAPRHVLTYVAAHEVAHLRHLDHGRPFWRTVDAILDGYVTEQDARREAASARDWLRRRGALLHRYG